MVTLDATIVNVALPSIQTDLDLSTEQLSTLAADRTTSWLGDLGHAPSAHEQAAGLVEGFQLAFTVSAGLMVVGVVLIAILLRRRDLARIDTTQPVMAGA
jgi:hypothetical protein